MNRATATKMSGDLVARHHPRSQRATAPYHLIDFTAPYCVLAWPYCPFTASFTD